MGMTTWLMPTGVTHIQPQTGPCATCGKRHYRVTEECLDQMCGWCADQSCEHDCHCEV